MTYLNQQIKRYNRLLTVGHYTCIALHTCSALALALLVVALSYLLHDSNTYFNTLLWLYVFALAMLCYRQRRTKLLRNDVLLKLDIDNATSVSSPYSRQDRHLWQAAGKRFYQQVRQAVAKRFSKEALRLYVLGTFALLVLTGGNISLSMLFPFQLPSVISLQVLPAGEIYQLGDDEPPTVQVHAHNLLQLTVNAPALPRPPLLQLQTQGLVYQQAQFSVLDEGDYQLTIRVDKQTELVIEELHGEKILANIALNPTAVPQVELTFASKITLPYPDEKPLPLRISARAQTPLAKVSLQINIGSESHTELINTIIRNDKHTFQTVYRVLLEPYVNSDLTEVELLAVVRDKNGIVGRSEPLSLQFISAYGRYQQTLLVLSELKIKLQEKIENPRGVALKELTLLLTHAISLAGISPFFDAVDRFKLKGMQTLLQQSSPDLLLITEKLNAFLFEHETLNDRERDRDFFVSMRRLVWAISANKDLKPLVRQIKKFLNERRARWKERVEIIASSARPPTWATIKRERPFLQSLSRIEKEAVDDKESIVRQSIVDYKEWLVELEEYEDNFKQKLQAEVNRKVTNARNELRSMQKRQASISIYLDKADARSRKELTSGWTTTRMQQNTNIKQAKNMSNSLKQVSALAAARMQTALRAMQMVNTCGKKKDFTCAETQSDLAGRLLHQARSATRSQLAQRRGRRRQTGSEQYFGQPVISGRVELQRDYKVNRKYREDILEEIQDSKLLEKHRDLLDSYLRKIVR